MNFKTWWVCGSLAEENTDKPFAGATKVVEITALGEAQEKIKELEDALKIQNIRIESCEQIIDQQEKIIERALNLKNRYFNRCEKAMNQRNELARQTCDILEQAEIYIDLCDKELNSIL